MDGQENTGDPFQGKRNKIFGKKGLPAVQYAGDIFIPGHELPAVRSVVIPAE